MILGFVLKSAGTQAQPADAALAGPRLSVFGTIHPELFWLGAPLGLESAGDRVRLASLEPQVELFDASAKVASILTDTACQNAPFEERFAALDDRHFDRFAWADDCASFDERFGLASFDERFGLAMRVLPGSPRLPPDHEVQNRPADEHPKATASTVHVRLAQPRNEVPQPRKEVPQEEDGRTAIYDITARTVYLPSGRRLEAHSGLGGFMDNPRHVHLRMRGATPPGLYYLTMRERLFHGVRAIRLNPADYGRMYGRDGILAHTYMLGANGQSNGCVSFNNYPEFLNAFLRGEVTRLAVVEHLNSPPTRLAAGQLPEAVKNLLRSTDRKTQYAAAGDQPRSAPVASAETVNPSFTANPAFEAKY